jgi:DNA-binding transcriptional ArsR family regulator
MLRIHFTGADLARTRLASAPDPLWELSLSVHLLRSRRPDVTLGDWRMSVCSELRLGSAARAEADLLLELNPPVGYFPDFLTPVAALNGFDEGVEAVLSTPDKTIRHDLDLLSVHTRPSAATVGLLRADGMRALRRSLTRYREVALDRIWPRVRAAVEADLAQRRRTLAHEGVEGLLAGLGGAARWTGGAIEIESYRGHREIHLDGRGLTLIPAYFKAPGKPITLVDPDLPPVLVYPINRGATQTTRPGALGELIGRTRSAVLETIADGCTTGEVAKRLNISPASASQHLTVLRDAGLVMSVREGNRVRHLPTTLGRTLLG